MTKVNMIVAIGPDNIIGYSNKLAPSLLNKFIFIVVQFLLNTYIIDT